MSFKGLPQFGGSTGVTISNVVFGGGPSTDSDAAAFLTAAGITDATQKDAVNDLVVALKADNIWDKMDAIYPMVGGTATTHKFNLKDPRDLDAAYRLSFVGTWTHASTGAVPTVAGDHANTFVVPTAALSQDSNHTSYYMRTDTGGGAVRFQIGAYTGGGIGIGLYNSGRIYAFFNTGGTDYGSSATVTTGLWVQTRTASAVHALFDPAGTKTAGTTASSPNISDSIYIGAINYNSGTVLGPCTGQECSFASIGDGLSDANAAALRTAVLAYQTALGR